MNFRCILLVLLLSLPLARGKVIQLIPWKILLVSYEGYTNKLKCFVISVQVSKMVIVRVQENLTLLVLRNAV